MVGGGASSSVGVRSPDDEPPKWEFEPGAGSFGTSTPLQANGNMAAVPAPANAIRSFEVRVMGSRYAGRLSRIGALLRFGRQIDLFPPAPLVLSRKLVEHDLLSGREKRTDSGVAAAPHRRRLGVERPSHLGELGVVVVDNPLHLSSLRGRQVQASLEHVPIEEGE